MGGLELPDHAKANGVLSISCSLNGIVEDISGSHENFLTRPADFFRNKTIYRFISPESHPMVQKFRHLLISGAPSQSGLLHLDGEGVVHRKVMANVSLLENHGYICVLMILPDNGHIRDEDSYRQMEVMRTTLESLDDTVVVLDRNGFFSELYSHDREAASPGFISAFKVGSQLSDVGFPDHVVDIFNEAIEKASIRRKTEQIFYTIKAFGGELYYQAKISPRFTSDNLFDGVTILIRDNTAIKKTEQKLKKSLEYFLTVLDNFPNPTWRLNSLKKFDYFNKTWAAFTGFDKQEQSLAQWKEYLHPDDQDFVLATFEEKFRDRLPFSLEYRILHQRGDYHWIKNFCQPLFDIKGRFNGYMGSCFDIDDIRKTQKLLQESESRYRAMVQEQDDLVVRWGADFSISFVNNSFSRFFDMKTSELSGRLLIDLFDKKQRPVIRKTMKGLLTSPKTDFFETEIADNKGLGRVFQWLNSPVFDKNGKVIEYQSVGRDITEKIEKEKENQVLLEKLNEKVKELSLLNKVSQYINEGLPEDTLFSILINDIKHSFNRPKEISVAIVCGEQIYRQRKIETAKIADEAVFAFGQARNYQLKIISLSRKSITSNDKPFLSKEEKELLKSVCDMLTSYIIKLDTEKKLLQSELRFRELFDSVLDIVFNLDMKGHILKINPAARKILGYDDFEGFVFWDYALPSEKENIDYMIAKSIKNKSESFTFETKALAESGEMIFLHVGGIIRYDSQNQPIEIFGIARDITEQKRIEQSIMKTVITTQEKERRRFAEDLHDGIGPLLSGLKMYLQQDSMAVDLNEKQLKVLKFCRELVDDAISQARSIANNLTPSVLNDFGVEKALVSHVAKINEIGKFTTILNIKSSLDSVENDIAIAIFRIMTELLNNALKHAKCSQVIIDIQIKRNILMMQYNDNGKGFDTKNPRSATSGSEVGINSINNRVHSLNGSISMKSKPGAGVLVELFIPLRNQ